MPLRFGVLGLGRVLGTNGHGFINTAMLVYAVNCALFMIRCHHVLNAVGT